MDNQTQDLLLAIEDLEISLDLSHLMEKELEFTINRFDKELAENKLNLQEYQHKLKFISALHSQQLSEMQLRIEKIKETIGGN